MFDGQWPDAVVPAAIQDPARVALGSGKAPGRAHVTLLAYGFAASANQRIDAEGEGRIIASYDLWDERPLAIDLDVAGRAYTAGTAARAGLRCSFVQRRSATETHAIRASRLAACATRPARSACSTACAPP